MKAKESKLVDNVVGYLQQAESVLVITGAGLSADSGLPTYRGIGGLYDRGDTEEGMPIEEILSGHTIRSNPELCWKYLGEIIQAATGAKPNRGHEVIAELESRFDRAWTLTQNIDGFHRQAGSRNVIEIHGNLHELVCPTCRQRQEFMHFDEITIPPVCCDCEAIMRPDVVFFGEMLPTAQVAELYGQQEQGFDLVLSVGTTSAFPYIAGPVYEARRQGKPSVEINPGNSEVSSIVDVKLAMGAAEALDEIWRRFLKK